LEQNLKIRKCLFLRCELRLSLSTLRNVIAAHISSHTASEPNDDISLASLKSQFYQFSSERTKLILQIVSSLLDSRHPKKNAIHSLRSILLSSLSKEVAEETKRLENVLSREVFGVSQDFIQFKEKKIRPDKEKPLSFEFQLMKHISKLKESLQNINAKLQLSHDNLSVWVKERTDYNTREPSTSREKPDVNSATRVESFLIEFVTSYQNVKEELEKTLALWNVGNTLLSNFLLHLTKKEPNVVFTQLGNFSFYSTEGLATNNNNNNNNEVTPMQFHFSDEQKKFTNSLGQVFEAYVPSDSFDEDLRTGNKNLSKNKDDSNQKRYSPKSEESKIIFELVDELKRVLAFRAKKLSLCN
jgi:hypothetical protein